MGIVVSAVASGLVQNIQKDFVIEEEKKSVHWREEEDLVEVKEEEGEERRVEIPGFPPITLDIPALHKEGGKQGRLSQQSTQTDEPTTLESILRTGESGEGDEGQSQTAKQEVITTTKETATATKSGLFHDFFDRIGFSPKHHKSIQDEDGEDTETNLKLIGNNILQNEGNEAPIGDKRTNNEDKKLLESQTKEVTSRPFSSVRQRHTRFDETPQESPSHNGRFGDNSREDQFGMPIVNLLPK